jgi:hypothetical protein
LVVRNLPKPAFFINFTFCKNFRLNFVKNTKLLIMKQNNWQIYRFLTLSEPTKTDLTTLNISLFDKLFYVFDLRPIESSMLFAVFRPLRTPVQNDQSSHI